MPKNHGRQRGHDTRRHERPDSRKRHGGARVREQHRRGRAPAEERILAALAKIPEGATARQLAESLHLDGDDGRALGGALRRLVEQGRVLEARPGRYRVSGTGGEHAAMVEPGSAPGALVARFPDERTAAVHPRHTIGARAGDVVQAIIGEDGFALVTRIIRRRGREVVGAVNFRPEGMVFIPDNRREGELPVLSVFAEFHRQYQAGDRVLGSIEIDPEGAAGVIVTSIVGEETPEIADFVHACVMHDLPGEFPPAVEAEARSQPRDFALGAREDLRGTLVFTIDPATAKDFDDAISLAPRPGGGWILGVHIADVSHFVREGSALDAEAAARSTSIYLINRVIPMLPEALSNGLCSLVPDEDRYCLSAFLELDAQDHLVGTRVAETLIRSRHRLTYEQALEILEDRDRPGAWPDDLVTTVRQVGGIAQRLRAQRERAGALNLYSVEHTFTLDVEGRPVEVGQEVSDISHQLIEECMLLANRAVASWLEQNGSPCVYRIHAPPDEERLRQFGNVLEAYGLDSSGAYERFGLQRILARLKQEPRPAQLVLNSMLLRCFKKAVYSTENIGHHALAFSSYCHFTSPIRRYPDLLVHRLAKRVLGLAAYRKAEARPTYLDALAKQASYLEQRSEDAERTLHARKSARYLSTRIGETLAGVVTVATGGGCFVQLLETGMEGMLPVRSLGDEYFEYDQERLALVGTRSGRVLGPGAELDVRIEAVDIERSDVTFGLGESEARERRGGASGDRADAALTRGRAARKEARDEERQRRRAEREARRSEKRSERPQKRRK